MHCFEGGLMKIGIIATVLFMLAVNAVANDDLLWEGYQQHHMRSDGNIETWQDYGNYGIRSDSTGNREMIFKQDIYPAFPLPKNNPEPYKPSFGNEDTENYTKPIYKPNGAKKRAGQGSWYDLSD